MSQLAADDFNRADGDPGSNWTVMGGGLSKFEIRSNGAGTDTNFNHETGLWTAITWPNDQYSELTATILAASIQAAVVRGSTGAQTAYLGGFSNADAGNKNRRIWKYVAGTYTSLATEAVLVAAGDVLRLEVQGTTIRLYVNGTLRLNATDSDIASGSPGLYLRHNNTSVAVLDDWSGGNFPIQQTVAGTLTSAGALVRKPKKTLAGALSTAGALSRKTKKALAGVLTTAGALTKKVKKALAGALSSAGALAKKTKKVLAAALSTAGALVTQYLPGGGGPTTYFKSVAGTLAPAGLLAKKTKKILRGGGFKRTDDFNRADGSPGGNWTGSGLVIAGNEITGSAAGSHSLMYWTGPPATDNHAAKLTIKSVPAGDVNSIGVAVRARAGGTRIILITIGNSSLRLDEYVSGVRTATVSYATALSPGDVMEARAIGDYVESYKNGTLLGVFAITQAVLKTGGTFGVAAWGAPQQAKGDDWEGTILDKVLFPAGLVVKKPKRALAAALATAGALRGKAKKALGGTLAPAGTLARRIRKTLAAVLAPAGALAKKTRRNLSGALSFVGGLVAAIVGLGVAVVTDVIIRPLLAAVARVRANITATSRRTRPNVTVDDVRRKE